MNLEPEICRRALESRDSRFDGRFFTGVVTTGVYCRPICPAVTPKLENVRFYPSAAAAGEAGFRPCLRCRPEAAPGTPAWSGTAASVSRALRLIAEGALDDGTVEELSRRLGIGARHLNRLFVRHLGASPVAVAQTRRLHGAKKLIDETDLPMAQVAFAAGFSSIRRFNDTFRRTYQRTPSELRQAAARGVERGADDGLLLRLPYRPPYDWDGVTDFLGARATPGVEIVDPKAYRRTIRWAGQQGSVEVRPAAPGESWLELRLFFPDPRALFPIVERMRRIFDLGADPREIASHLGRDPLLSAALGKNAGLRVPGAWDGFELAIRAILGQQVTVRGATTLAGRLARSYGEPCASSRVAGLEVIFPGPEALLDAELTDVGLPAARAAAIRHLAAAVVRGEVRLDATVDPETLRQQLTALPGIGEWTAQYVAMRALGEPDAFPASDLGLLKAAADGTKKLTPAALQARAEAWRPWRAYAAMHLWSQGPSSNPPQETSTSWREPRAGGRADFG